jgi:hypothetical protein
MMTTVNMKNIIIASYKSGCIIWVDFRLFVNENVLNDILIFDEIIIKVSAVFAKIWQDIRSN